MPFTYRLWQSHGRCFARIDGVIYEVPHHVYDRLDSRWSDAQLLAEITKAKLRGDM